MMYLQNLGLVVCPAEPELVGAISPLQSVAVNCWDLGESLLRKATDEVIVQSRLLGKTWASFAIIIYYGS